MYKLTAQLEWRKWKLQEEKNCMTDNFAAQILRTEKWTGEFQFIILKKGSALKQKNETLKRNKVMMYPALQEGDTIRWTIVN